MTTLLEINTKIKTLRDAEKITKKILGELSRELMTYVLDPIIEEEGDEIVISLGEKASFDIDAINRCIAVLTPMNKRTACLYFEHFLPFSFDENTLRFGGRDKNKKRLAKKVEILAEFLEVEDNNIWTWAEENVKLDKKPVDYFKKIASDIKNALDEDKGGMSAKDVFNAVLDGGLTAADILACIDMVEEQIVEQVDVDEQFQPVANALNEVA